MHLLPCPNCESPIPVTPSEAGQQTSCPACEGKVDVPTLGRLRQLPLAESESADSQVSVGRDEVSAGGQIGFLLCGLVATICLLIAVYCGIRWAMIETPITSEEHIAALREGYKTLSPAQLIREYEDMEEYGLGLSPSYKYHSIAKVKHNWGRNGAIAATVGGLSVLGAFAIGAARRKRN